jgi:hypothetical protein
MGCSPPSFGTLEGRVKLNKKHEIKCLAIARHF